MREGIVIGRVTSTVKVPSLVGKKMLIVQPLDAAGEAYGLPEAAPDYAGAGKGDRVLLSWDGIYMCDVHDDPETPIRVFVCGIIDSVSGPKR